MRTVTDEELKTELTSFADALAFIDSNFSALPSLEVPLLRSTGLVAAAEVTAGVDVPGFDNSAMDGYAIRTSDMIDKKVTPVAHIATGAPIRPGVDAVVPWEDASELGGVIQVDKVVPGQHIRRTGHDITRGSVVIKAGTVLNAVHLGALAAIGRTTVEALPRPRVSILVTGDEIVAPGASLGDAGVYDVNTTMLTALLASYGADVVKVEHAGDDRDETRHTLAALARDADLVVTAGGASVGERDWVRNALEADGKILLWRIAVRPGKPFAVGEVEQTPVLVLPGNPGSVLACTHSFASRVLRQLSGRAVQPALRSLTLGATVVNEGGRTFVCPARIDGQVATPLVGASSQGIMHATETSGFIIVGPDETLVEGEPVDVELAFR